MPCPKAVRFHRWHGREPLTGAGAYVAARPGPFVALPGQDSAGTTMSTPRSAKLSHDILCRAKTRATALTWCFV